jgi:mevalonate kinase
VLSAIIKLKDRFDCGFTLMIHSEFEGALGLGSSTAVVVAVIAALLKSLAIADVGIVFKYALSAIRTIQSKASGADVAASVYGGVVIYDPVKKSVLPIEKTLSCFLIYSGKKTKTADVLKHIDQCFAQLRDKEQTIYSEMGTIVKKAHKALLEDKMTLFFDAVEKNQDQMVSLQVCNKKLSEIINYAKLLPGVQAAKISGSGLGDCAVVFGTIDKSKCPYPVIDVSIDKNGVMYR